MCMMTNSMRMRMSHLHDRVNVHDHGNAYRRAHDREICQK